MFTFSPIKQRVDLLTDYVKQTTRDGEPLKDDPRIRAQIAKLHTDAEVARVMGLKVVDATVRGEKIAEETGTPSPPPTVESSEYKLFATEFSRRLANAAMDIAGPGSQLRVHTEDAPMKGRSESTYRYTVIDTIGGGAPEIQKNIIARRGLGLPKNF
jgi:alkylation response protein AidB-like acyl-CoA dehydrogenase